MIRLSSRQLIRFHETPSIFPFRRKIGRCLTMEHGSRNYCTLPETQDYEVGHFVLFRSLRIFLNTLSSNLFTLGSCGSLEFLTI